MCDDASLSVALQAVTNMCDDASLSVALLFSALSPRYHRPIGHASFLQSDSVTWTWTHRLNLRVTCSDLPDYSELTHPMRVHDASPPVGMALLHGKTWPRSLARCRSYEQTVNQWAAMPPHRCGGTGILADHLRAASSLPVCKSPAEFQRPNLDLAGTWTHGQPCYFHFQLARAAREVDFKVFELHLVPGWF
ncbi:hypothetical protein JB92DRAFT_2827698 [Gautieria morchelliformis]|nr:hypothetical protein JB92DRAFT_2827698 [Gautieria morchelliformis]